MTDAQAEPIDAVLARAIAALADLAERGEAIADEWQYVNDLLRIHSADLRALAVADARPVAPAGVRAVELLIDEAGRIADPHRAIDWLSTFPQVARLALALRT